MEEHRGKNTIATIGMSEGSFILRVLLKISVDEISTEGTVTDCLEKEVGIEVTHLIHDLEVDFDIHKR